MDPLFWAIILVLAGMFVFFLELFIPSAGILGVLSAALMIAGIVVGFSHSYATGAVLLLVTGVTFPFYIALLVKIWPSTPIGRRILIQTPTEEDVLPTGNHLDALKGLLNKVGIAKTKMLPSGMISVDGQKYDAVSDGFAIDQGEKVRVVAIRFNRIYVQPYNPDEDVETNFNDANLLNRSINELGIDSIDDSRS